MQFSEIARVPLLIKCMDFHLIFFQDPTNPLSREEQKKAWQEQGHKNVLAKDTMEAFGWEYVSTDFTTDKAS